MQLGDACAIGNLNASRRVLPRERAYPVQPQSMVVIATLPTGQSSLIGEQEALRIQASRPRDASLSNSLSEFAKARPRVPSGMSMSMRTWQDIRPGGAASDPPLLGLHRAHLGTIISYLISRRGFRSQPSELGENGYLTWRLQVPDGNRLVAKVAVLPVVCFCCQGRGSDSQLCPHFSTLRCDDTLYPHRRYILCAPVLSLPSYVQSFPQARSSTLLAQWYSYLAIALRRLLKRIDTPPPPPSQVTVLRALITTRYMY